MEFFQGTKFLSKPQIDLNSPKKVRFFKSLMKVRLKNVKPKPTSTHKI